MTGDESRERNESARPGVGDAPTSGGGTGEADVTRPGEYRCDLCGAPMQEWHCRIICTYCGYQRDCSDP